MWVQTTNGVFLVMVFLNQIKTKQNKAKNK